MRNSTLLLWPAALLLFGACLDIERTPAPDSGGAGGLAGVGGADDFGGVPNFDPSPCVQACVERTPAAKRSFALVMTCTEDARANACADTCSGAATGSDPGGETCPVPGEVNADANCSRCLKQACCAELSRCFADYSCIAIGICATGCGG